MTVRRFHVPMLGLAFGLVMLAQSGLCALDKFEWKFDPDAGPTETVADKMTYDRNTGWVEATGHVVIKRPGEELRADRVRMNVKTGEGFALGNVVLTKDGNVIEGTRLTRDAGEDTWQIEDAKGVARPFHIISSEEVKKNDASSFTVRNAAVTTCTNAYPHCHFHVRAREMEITPGDHIQGWGAVWYLGGVPVMYLPYWYRILDEDLGVSLRPGSSSRMGAFLLSAVSCRLDPTLRAETRLDLMSRRGVAVGQAFSWKDRDGKYSGDVSTYYLNDKNPVDDDEDAATADIGANRHRIRLRHYCGLGSNDYLLLHSDYLSDSDMLEDFFEDEYRDKYQPENYAVYTVRGSAYAGHVQVQGRLNDFYTGVNRLPECSVDFLRQPVGNTPLYYEGGIAAGLLQKEWAKSAADRDDYSSVRLDTAHTVYCPVKWLGFLSVVPRAGYRATYYSKTRDTETVVETVASATNGAQSVATNTVVRDVEMGADVRSRAEFGTELSFKAFKTFGSQDFPLRHVIEPYANYTFVPEPNLLPANICQFDSIDRLGQEHWAKLGVRNKLQAKREGRPFDLIDADVYTIYRFERAENERAVQDLYLDAEFRCSSRVKIDMDGIYDLEEGAFARFNAQIWLRSPDAWNAGLEFRHIMDESSLLSGNLTIDPNSDWTFNVYGRYEMEDGRMEEEGGYMQRNLDCMKIRFGAAALPGYTRTDGTEQDDEWRVTVEMWLTAFPGIGLTAKQGN